MSSPDSGLKILTTSAKQIMVPNALKSYAGIRFIDVRYLKDYIGFVSFSKNGNFHKLKTQNAFEEELNKIDILGDSNSFSKVSDSILIVIKNFWFNRNVNEKNNVYCHISALFFIKKSSEVYYDYKIDTFYNYKDLFGNFYKESIDRSINDLLLSYQNPATRLTKKYSQDEFNANVRKKRISPKKVNDSTGLFLTYSDFLNGNLYKIDVDLNPFFDQFTFTIKDEGLNVKLHKSLWGVMYKGNLYIRTENLLCRAFTSEGTYIARSNIEINDARSGNYMPNLRSPNNSNSDLYAVSGLGTAAMINLLKTKKAKIKSYPVILNIESGELE